VRGCEGVGRTLTVRLCEEILKRAEVGLERGKIYACDRAANHAP
jgi:hypothetical protein